jgi:hypothetical protein
MKKAIILGLGLLFIGASCTKVDNYPGPDSAFQGNIIDSVTGKNMLTETGGVNIMLKGRSKIQGSSAGIIV